MDLYLATPLAGHGGEKDWRGLNILESFWYARNDATFPSYYATAEKFLMDSGAFTFMEQKRQHDWDKYTDAYIEFINKYDIKLFFEMDIDSVAGLDVAERLRERIENGTGKKSIPVWHINRGKQYFIDMCKAYPYVAFGGLMSDGKSRQELEKAFPWFINTAHENGAKIHALGYTSVEGVKRFNFDSVDSSSWTCGSIYASMFHFDDRGGTIIKKNISRKGLRMKTSGKPILEHDWKEWVKFQQWLSRNR